MRQPMCVCLLCVFMSIQSLCERVSLNQDASELQVRDSVTQLGPGETVNGDLQDEVESCVQFANQALPKLSNTIEEYGVVKSCPKLCDFLDDENIMTCYVVCHSVTMETFLSNINKANLDPIYFCELLGPCAEKTAGECSDVMTVTSFGNRMVKELAELFKRVRKWTQSRQAQQRRRRKKKQRTRRRNQ